MKLGAFRIRPLPGGGYLHCIFSLVQSSPVLGSCFRSLNLSHWGYRISPNSFLQAKGEFAFFLHLSAVSFCAYHETRQELLKFRVHQQKYCARCTYKRVKEMVLAPLLFHSRNILSLESFSAKYLLFVTLNFFLFFTHDQNTTFMKLFWMLLLKCFAPNPFLIM